MTKILTKFVVVCALGAAFAIGSAVPFRTVVAQSTTPAFSGVCSGLLNFSNPWRVAQEQNRGGIDNEGISGSATFDFTSSKVSLVVNQGDFTGEDTIFTPRIFSNLSFTAKNFSAIAGSKILTIDIKDNGGEQLFLFIPVNGGNTFLVQGLSNVASGVCQKV